MKIEKFLDKIAQDERVKEITYEKGWGYRLSLKDGYGVLKTSGRSQWVDSTYYDYTETWIEKGTRESSQSDIEWYLGKVVKCNQEEIELKNKNEKLNALKRLQNQTAKLIKTTQDNIDIYIEKKKNLEQRKTKVDEVLEIVRKEVEAYGTTE